MVKASRPFSVRSRLESFGHAFRGIASLMRSEHNARIHAVATILVVGLGIGLEIDRLEWLAIILTISVVWSAEAINTGIEALCDVVSPEQDPRIETVKDAAAGAVLIAALGALGVGLLVFGPRVLLMIESVLTGG